MPRVNAVVVRPLAVGVLVVLGACRTTRELQRETAQQLTPRPLEAPLRPDTEAPIPIREFTVRVYADGDYQRQMLRWEERIRSQIARANHLLEAQFGVRLVIRGIRSWKRTGQTDSLEKVLHELQAVDSAADVDWVFGFTSAVSASPASQEAVGKATQPGRYLVLRAMVRPQDTDRVDATLANLQIFERDTVIRERTVHRETAALLHEWGHTVGAFHEPSQDSLMSHDYSPKMVGFSSVSTHLIETSIAHWGARDAAGREAWARAYRDELARLPANAAASQADLEKAREYAERLVASTSKAGRGPVARADAGRKRFDIPMVSDHVDDGEALARPQAVSNVASTAPSSVRAPEATSHDRRLLRPPSDEVFQACFNAFWHFPRTDSTLEACRRAAADPSPRPEAFLLLAHALLHHKEMDAAVAVLVRAEDELLRMKKGADWAYLTRLYNRANTCTGAERAAQHVPDDPGAAQAIRDCTRERRRVALPRDGKGVPLEREHAYSAVIKMAQRDIDDQRLVAARARAEQIELAFPGSAGPALIACLSAGKARNSATAKAACAAANAAAPEASAPFLVLGRVAAREARWDEARRLVERSIALDDDNAEAWRTLADVYAYVGDAQALADLTSRYRKKFFGELTVEPQGRHVVEEAAEPARPGPLAD